MIYLKLKYILTIIEYKSGVFAFCIFAITLDLVTKNVMLIHYLKLEDIFTPDVFIVKLNNVPTLLQLLGLEWFNVVGLIMVCGIWCFTTKALFDCARFNHFLWGEALAFIGLSGNIISWFIWGGVPDFLPLTINQKLFYFNIADFCIVSALIIYFCLEPLFDLYSRIKNY